MGSKIKVNLSIDAFKLNFMGIYMFLCPLIIMFNTVCINFKLLKNMPVCKNILTLMELCPNPPVERVFARLQ